jgi:hypothetical protein
MKRAIAYPAALEECRAANDRFSRTVAEILQSD